MLCARLARRRVPGCLLQGWLIECAQFPWGGEDWHPQGRWDVQSTMYNVQCTMYGIEAPDGAGMLNQVMKAATRGGVEVCWMLVALG